MPIKKGLITLSGKYFIELDDIPTNGGFTAPIGSTAFVSKSGVGSEWLKFGAGDMDWVQSGDSGAIVLTPQQMPAVINANYTVQENDYVIRYDSHLGSFNIQLPDPTLGRRVLKFIDVRSGDSDSNGVYLVPFSTERIGGFTGPKQLTAQFGPGQTLFTVYSDLIDWWQEGITF